jgi:predicted ATPase/DNA-binding SARP family transcriptional activator
MLPSIALYVAPLKQQSMMSQLLRVTLLGSPTITLGDQPLTGLLTGKVLALFAYLAVNRQPHTRDHLADLLWSECSNQQARNNLRYLLPDLRHHLATHLTITSQTIGFNRQAPYWLDVEVLQATLATQSPTIGPMHQTNATPIDLPALQAALDLYQGKFLAGFTVRNAPVFEAWVRQQQDEIHQVTVQGFYTLAAAHYQAGESQAGLTVNQQLLRWAPWHEVGHRLQMRLLVAAGQRSAALAHYALCCQLLADELGVEPEAATSALYKEIRAGAYDKVTGWQGEGVTSDQVTSTSSVTLSPLHPVTPSPCHPRTQSLPHNLPGQLTPFIGRATELLELCTLLTDAVHPLITLTGLGGVGKTRLALAVGQALMADGRSIVDSGCAGTIDQPAAASHQSPAPRFPDGLWFVPLIGLAAGENLADRLAVAIMDALHLPRVGPLAPQEQLLDGLRERRLLLILDNFEHLLAGVELLYILLQQAPNVKLLVTSRQILNLQAEFVWQLDGLVTPAVAAGAAVSSAEAQRYDSVALFVERAQRVDRAFQLDQSNQALVLRLCRFVEGLPLGIELAAAMLRYHTCAELWRSVQQDYRVLAATQRDVPPRHRTITALFDFSWRLLTPPQARTLAACAIFPQSFTAEAAIVVADATHAILAALIDQSLLKQTDEGCFEFHELVRQYAAEQLTHDLRQLAQVRQRHAYYFAALVEPDVTALLRLPTKLHFIQQELPNLRVAWLWAIGEQHLWPLRQMSQGLFVHFLTQGPLQEGWDLCDMALKLLQRLPLDECRREDLHLLASALACQSYWGYYLGRYEEAIQLAQKALAIAEPLTDGRALALAYLGLAWAAFAKGDFAAQERLCAQGVAAARTGAVPYLVVLGLAQLGFGLALQSKMTEALGMLHEALQLLQTEQLVYLEGYVLGELGFIYAMTGDWALADGTMQQALHLNQGINNNLNRRYQYERLALSAEALGDYQRALAWTDQALASDPLIPDPVNQLSVLLVRGRVLRYLGDIVQAETACQQVLRQAQTLGRPSESAQAQIELGHVLLAQRQRQLAEIHYHAALGIAATGPLSWQAAAQAGLAQIQLQQQQVAKALPWAEPSLHLLLTQPLDMQYDAAAAALTCYQVLTAAVDQRAALVLQRACDWVAEQAVKISDESLRRSFLDKAPYHCQLQALRRAAGAGAAESVYNSP